MNRKVPEDKRIQDFRRRWNIEVDAEQELRKFQQRILQNLESAMRQRDLDEVQFLSDRFAYRMGIPRQDLVGSQGIEKDFADTPIGNAIHAASTLSDIVFAIQNVFWAEEDERGGVLYEDTVFAIKDALILSPSVNVRLVDRGGSDVTLYPAGAKELDEALVNDTLAWLETYPKVAAPFEEALNIYLTKDASKYRNLLDNLRFAVEQLLRSVLNNRKSLENQDKVLLPWLKERGVHQQVINMYRDLLNQFARYQNDAVKHDEAFALAELEFMIYLTGTFIRFILELQAA